MRLSVFLIVLTCLLDHMERWSLAIFSGRDQHCFASLPCLWCAVKGAVNCNGLSVELLAEAFHGMVFGLVQEDCRFFAASFMVWMYCELPESPVSAYL